MPRFIRDADADALADHKSLRPLSSLREGIDWSVESDIDALRDAFERLSIEPRRAMAELEKLAQRGSGVAALYIAYEYEHRPNLSKNFEEAYTKNLRSDR